MKVTKHMFETAPHAKPSIGARLTHPSTVLFIGLLLLAFILGFIACEQGWHRTLRDFGEALTANPELVLSTVLGQDQLPILHVDMDFESYQYLLTQRERALQRGVQLASLTDQGNVQVTFTYAETRVDADVRLLEGPATMFEGDRWPFQTTALDPDGVLGMQWATLTPAHADSLLSWGYLASLRAKGHLAPRYTIARLVVNGKDWGLYALEELPSNAMLEAQGRSQAVLACFDPHRYLHAQGSTGTVPLPGHGFAYAETTVTRALGATREERAEALEDDASLRAAQTEVLDLLHKLETGQIPPSQIFPPEMWGEFLALTTLWRGTPALDWQRLCLAYDPTTQHFELIGKVAQAVHTLPTTTLPNFFLDDPTIQRAYVVALEMTLEAAYVPRLQAELGSSLETLRLATSNDFGYPPSPWAILAENQTLIQRQLAPPLPLEAVLTESNRTLVITLSNLQPYPVEVLGIDWGENFVSVLNPDWVADDATPYLVNTPTEGLVLRALSTETPHPIALHIPHTALPTETEGTSGNISIVARLWGLEEPRITVPVQEPPLYAPLEEE